MTTASFGHATPSGLLTAHFDDFLSQLRTAGYAAKTVRHKRTTVRYFAQWMTRQQITLDSLTDSHVARFCRHRRICAKSRRHERGTLCRLLRHLRARSLIKTPVVDRSPAVLLQERYAHYLRQDRGLAENSLRVYVPLIRDFLAAQRGTTSDFAFNAHMIRDHILGNSAHRSNEHRHLLVAALRSFLHFLFLRGYTVTDLSTSVPMVRTYSQASVPAYLPTDDIERLLRSPDRATPRGRRDHAILLLLARLGLRASEIVSLEMGDLRWRSGEIVIRGKSRVIEHLPLLDEIGEALTLYLLKDRGASRSKRCFLRMFAPHVGLTGPAAVGHIVRFAFARAGVRRTSRGAAHLFRHSLATTMIRQGASMAQIAEVLRHRSQTTTAIYAKVSFESLRGVARAWPMAGGVQ